MASLRAGDSNRILFVVGQLSYGGLERQLIYLISAMDRTRYRPAIVVWSSDGSEGYTPQVRTLGVPLYFLGRDPSRISKIMTLRRIVEALRPEVVHSFSFYTNYAAYLAGLNTHTVAVGSLRSDIHADIQRVGKVIGLLSARWPCHQVSNNIATVQHLHLLTSFLAPRHVHIVRNAVDLQAFRDQGRCSDRGVNIVGVGSLIPTKRWDRLLNAAGLLMRNGYHFTVRIAGAGPLRNALLDQAKRLGISEQVTFPGQVTDIPRFISEGTFLVHVSDTEGCPNAVMEGMACGRAIIATRVGDVPYLVEDGQTGFLIDREDAGSLVSCMARLLDHPELGDHMGRMGRLKAEREFGLSRFVHDMLAAYSSAGWQDTASLT